MKHTKKVAVAAILSSVSVILIILGTYLQILDITATALASFLIMLAVIELGGAYPYLIWLVSGTLALLLAPDKFGAVLYLLFGGIYPIFKAMFERLHPIVSWILKLSFFNTSLTLAVIVINFVFGIPDSGIGFAAATYALGNLAFVLYDVAATSAVTLYLIKLRKRLRLGNYFDKKL